MNPEKPILTRDRADWLVHVAGVRAATKAHAEGAPPEDAANALADAAVLDDGYPLGPFRLHYNAITVQLLECLTARYREAGEPVATGHVVFLLAEPRQAWLRLRTRRAFDLDDFESCVFAFLSSISLADVTEANTWFQEEQARVQSKRQAVPDLPQTEARAE